MEEMTLFLAGDVMTGRGIDQILPHPGDPRLHEGFMTSAIGYVRLAEQASGPIRRPVDYHYIWGDAIEELDRIAPDIRIINLETSITQNGAPWPDKAVLYRMNPENIPCLTVARIDVCSLANNHTLDWGYKGLEDTLATLERVGIHYAGAGRDLARARAPVAVNVPGKGRVVIVAIGSPTSGIPLAWQATAKRPGLNITADFAEDDVRRIREQVEAVKKPGDVVVASIHWGPNWGFGVATAHTRFAHALIESAGVDVVHGHSSHHVKGIEVHRGRLILYGCGDFLDDYEGISGYEAFRDDLGLMYFPILDLKTGALIRLRMTPTRIRRMRINRATGADVDWLINVLNEQGERFGTSVELAEDGRLSLRWS
ncbi:MAG: CapA family protein [Isosphaeraceae bacterium]|nr:CapA family protein [Isosphaeraceae bacterium]